MAWNELPVARTETVIETMEQEKEPEKGQKSRKSPGPRKKLMPDHLRNDSNPKDSGTWTIKSPINSTRAWVIFLIKAFQGEYVSN